MSKRWRELRIPDEVKWLGAAVFLWFTTWGIIFAFGITGIHYLAMIFFGLVLTYIFGYVVVTSHREVRS